MQGWLENILSPTDTQTDGRQAGRQTNLVDPERAVHQATLLVLHLRLGILPFVLALCDHVGVDHRPPLFAVRHAHLVAGVAAVARKLLGPVAAPALLHLLEM